MLAKGKTKMSTQTQTELSTEELSDKIVALRAERKSILLSDNAESPDNDKRVSVISLEVSKLQKILDHKNGIDTLVTDNQSTVDNAVNALTDIAQRAENIAYICRSIAKNIQTKHTNKTFIGSRSSKNYDKIRALGQFLMDVTGKKVTAIADKMNGFCEDIQNFNPAIEESQPFNFRDKSEVK